MKKLSALILISTVLVFCSCGRDKENETAAAAPEGMHALDLSSYGRPFSIYVPDTTKSKLLITEQSSGELYVKVGGQFAVSIRSGFSDLSIKKQDIQTDEVNKMKSIDVDEPEGIVWQSAITEPEFHFVRNSKAGTEEFSFEDIRREDGNGYGKETIEQMYNSCKNIVPANHSEASH